MLVRFPAKELASVNRLAPTRDAAALAVPATREAAGLKIAEAGEKAELGALMQVCRNRAQTISQRIRELYPTALPVVVTVKDGKVVHDLAADAAVVTRRQAAGTYDKLASVLADVRRMAIKRGSSSVMSLVLVGDKLQAYERTAGPLHPASVRARFNKA
jgi:hypothetical protein